MRILFFFFFNIVPGPLNVHFILYFWASGHKYRQPAANSPVCAVWIKSSESVGFHENRKKITYLMCSDKKCIPSCMTVQTSDISALCVLDVL